MKNKILYSICLLTIALLLVSFVRFYLLQKQEILEDSLITQSEIRSYIDAMILSMNTAQFVVYVRQTNNKIDNDKIIDSINTFEDTLLKLTNKYKFEIDRDDCMSCHVAINEKMVRVDNSLSTIISLLNEYKINVSLMFTIRDKELKEKVIKKIGETGSGIVSEINRINHISSKMMNAIDIKIKKDYLMNKKIVLITLIAGVIVTLLILIYLLIYLNKDITRFNQQIDVIADNNYIKKLESAKFDIEMGPIVNASNKLIEEINYREKKIKEKNDEINKINLQFEELKQNLEYKVEQRTKELNEANREMLTNQIKKDKLYNELQVKTNELVEKNKQLQELDKMKSEFVHMVNHELRSPMVTIKGYTELLLNNKNVVLPDQAVQNLTVMQRSINRLNNIIENIRTLTIIDSDRKKTRISKINITKILNDVYNDMLILTSKRSQNLKIEVQNNYPSILYNEEQLYQCLTNLITNSIRYSPDESNITIGALCDEGKKEIIFYVKDTGMGIEEKEFKNIFLPFYEIKNITEHHSGTIEFNSAGTGLGLTIVKKIVESYNGRIWVESPGLWKGSTFYFTIPFDL